LTVCALAHRHVFVTMPSRAPWHRLNPKVLNDARFGDLGSGRGRGRIGVWALACRQAGLGLAERSHICVVGGFLGVVILALAQDAGFQELLGALPSPAASVRDRPWRARRWLRLSFSLATAAATIGLGGVNGGLLAGDVGLLGHIFRWWPPTWPFFTASLSLT